MPTPYLFVLGVVALVGLGVLFAYGRRVARSWLRYRGTRVVVCPENGQRVAVEVDAPHAAWTAPQGHSDVRLADCTRWPEKAGCGQECLAQIEAAPHGCRLQALLAEWYRDRPCVYCGRLIREIRWHDHRPALRSPAGELVAWSDFRAEQVLEVLATHRAVCWGCYTLEQFRRDHPDLVTDRPERPSPPPSMV
jgi:hypothetical protein